MNIKNNLANLIAKINFKILSVLGRNLPSHVALNIIGRDNNYYLHNKSLTLNTQIMNDCNNIYEAAIKKTGMEYADNFSKRIRHNVLFQLVSSAIKNDHGRSQLAECGCWKGQSAYIIAKSIEENKFKNSLFIFDSFEGLSDFTENDLLAHTLEDTQKQKKTFAASEELVKKNLTDFDFIKYFKGWIPARFNEIDDQKFCFVNIDVDLYDPIKASLEFFYPRLVVGGIIFLDDYGFNQFPGATKAIDEFVAHHQPSHFISLPTGGGYLIK